MRIKIWDRILAALVGLLALAAGVCVALYGAGLLPIQVDFGKLLQSFAVWQRAAVIAAGVVLTLLGLHGLSLLFRSNKEKGFIMQHTEYGDLSISMHAMENMVKKCIDTHDELQVTGTRIRHARDGVVVDMRISLANGVNIPITVSALQKQIKHYITSCSGVDVKEVRVMVETNNSAVKPVDEVLPDFMADDVNAIQKAGSVAESLGQNPALGSTAEVEPEKEEAIHQRIFRSVEEPQIVPAPPEIPEGDEEEAIETAGAEDESAEDAESKDDAEPAQVEESAEKEEQV